MEDEIQTTKSEARYVDQAFVGQTVCWLCQFLQEGMKCKRVVGIVERTGTCDNALHVLKNRNKNHKVRSV